MTSIKVYKLLQQHVSIMNLLTQKLGNEELSKKEVTEIVIEKLTVLLKELN